MNLILVEKAEICNDLVRLSGRRADHVIKVLQSRVGETVRIGVINGKTGTAIVTALERKHPRCVDLTVQLTRSMPEKPVIDLILALPRPIMLKRILSQAAALGVGEIFLVQANRVEKSFWNATLLQSEKIRENLIQGLEQARDTRIPEVSLYNRFKPFVEDVLPGKIGGYSHLLLGHPDATISLAESIPAGFDRVLLAVGPEGGWVDYEVKRFEEIGFVPFTLGQRILKVDTAVISLHGSLSIMRQVNKNG